MIQGVGLDLFDVARIEREVSRPGSDLLDELLTPAEREACAADVRPALGWAARYAAKEAVFKALGTGKVGPMGWHDIEVTTPRGGSPAVRLSGQTAVEAARLGVAHVLLSLALTRTHAVAWAVTTGDDVSRQ